VAGEGSRLQNPELEPLLKKSKISYEWQIWTSISGMKYYDRNFWNEDANATTFAFEFLTALEEALSADVIKISTKSYLFAPSREMSLFLRSTQKKFWIEIFDFICKMTPQTNHVIVTGNPGIGKTWSFLYFLLLLLRAGKMIVFEPRSQARPKTAYVFVPSKDLIPNTEFKKYQVFFCNNWQVNLCDILNNPDIYYLVDLSKDSESKGVAAVLAHTVVCASPRLVTSQLKEFRDRETAKFVMPVWKLEECLALKDHFPVEGKTFSTEIIQNRYALFGGILRYIFADSSHIETYKELLHSSFRNIKFELVKDVLNMSGELPREKSEAEEPSMIFVMDEKGSSFDRTTDWKYQYNKDNIIVRLASQTILLEFLSRYWKAIAQYLDPTGIVRNKFPVFSGLIFEVVFRIILHFENDFDTFVLENDKLNMPLKIKTEATTAIMGPDWVGYFLETASLSDSKMEATSRIIAVPEASNQPNVDLMDKCDRAFQVTASEQHSLKEKYLYMQLFCNSKISRSQPLNLYFVILGSIDNFKLNRETYNLDVKSLFNEKVLEKLLRLYLKGDDADDFILRNKRSNTDEKERRKGLAEKLQELFGRQRPDTDIRNSFKFFVLPISKDFLKSRDNSIQKYVEKLLSIARQNLEYK
jgi:hypothetical protein